MKASVHGCLALRFLTWALALAVAQHAHAAESERTDLRRGDSKGPQQAENDIEELGEVVVEGYKPIRDHELLRRWLPRLVGRFDLSGSLRVITLEQQELINANGLVVCTGIQGSAAPTVHCEFDVRWSTHDYGDLVSSAVPRFQPAAVVFGYSVDRGPVIRHLLVDGEGNAEGAAGVLISTDTLISRTKCLSTPGACERVTKVTATADMQQVTFEVAIVFERRTVQSMRLTMHRQP